MRHRYARIKLNRNTDERKRLTRHLIVSFLSSGRLMTTRPRSAVVISEVERLIRIGKKQTLSSMRQVAQVIDDSKLVDDFIHRTIPALKERQSGFVRRILLENRPGDNAPVVRLEWTDKIGSSKEKGKEAEDGKPAFAEASAGKQKTESKEDVKLLKSPKRPRVLKNPKE